MLRSLVLFGLIAAAPAAQAAGDWIDDDALEHTLGSDRFAAGRIVTLDGPIAGDAFAAGGRVTLDGPVGGDAFLAGAHVEARGPVEAQLMAVGAVVVASGSVRHGARLAGGSVEVTPAAHVGGNVSMAGERLAFAGSTDGSLQMAGRDVLVTGAVRGDAEISAARIEIGPGARIEGQLRYQSDREPVVATGATIGGGLERVPGAPHRASWRAGARHALHGVGSGLWWTGSLALGVLWLLLAPAMLSRTSGLARSEWPLCLGAGLGLVVAGPVLAVLLMVTLIGIPLALLVIAAYAVLLLLGHVAAAVAVGDYALGRLTPTRAAAVGWRVLALAVALLALALLRRVPLVGGLATALVLLAGVGALAVYALRSRRPAAA